MTKSNINNPFAGLILDDEEQALEAALEAGEFETEPDFADTKQMLERAAAQYHQLHTSKPVTLRVNQLDLIKIKAKAKRHNIPYQTLLGSVLHDFAESKNSLSIR